MVRRAARAAAAALERQVTPGTLRDDAVVKLLAGQPGSAIERLSQAADLAPSSAVIWSDLAVAHLQQGRLASDPYELVRALVAATRAVRFDPDLEAARFNRALALERLSLDRRAAEDWRTVLQTEDDPLWAREAEMHVEKLSRSIVSRNRSQDFSEVRALVEQGKLEGVRRIVANSPQDLREYVEGELLVTWARAEKARDRPTATRILALSRAIADALVFVGGDPLAARTVAQIDRAFSSKPEQLHRLVAGLLLYAEGLDLSREAKCKEASSHFAAARDVLLRERSPFAYWATYQVAYCMYQGAQYDQAAAEVQALLRDPSSRPYQAVRGRALSLKGLMEGIEGHWAESLVSLEAAESAFRAIHELPQAAKVNATLAEELNILGKPKEAWRRLYPALIESKSFGRPEIRSFACLHASWLAQGEGEIGVALEFQDEVVRNARLIGRPQNLVGALRQRASLLAALGRTAEAAEDLKQARSYLQQIPELRRIVEGDLLLVESELAASAAPELAIAKLDGAIEIFRDTSYHYRLGDALYRRALAHKALGDPEEAERDLADAIAELEQQRETIDSADYRISYLDRVKDIFDTMIELRIEERQQPAEALHVSEQARARVLWDWMVTRPTGEPGLPHLRPAAAESFSLGALRRGIPEGTAVVEYAVLPRKTIAWVFRNRGGLQWERLEIGSAEVDDLTGKLRRAVLEDRNAEIEPLAERAYDLLIRPIERHLAPGERLVLVPDGSLHALPFSVLRDSKTGRYLFQDRVLAVAPSLRVYVESLRRDRALARGGGNVLVVAAPEFDPGIDPTLPPLEADETEASIAEIFPGRVLRGREATRQAFLDAAPDFELVHFGGHSVVNVEHPLLSQMLFAADPADPSRGVLYSGDVLLRSFPRTRLVVLASCGTAAGRISRTEGIENLARPFLAAGVPTVVASLWSVEDQATADFFVRFYRNLKQGHDVARALQATQSESFDLAGPAASPRVWSAFEVIGGGLTASGGGHTGPPRERKAALKGD